LLASGVGHALRRARRDAAAVGLRGPNLASVRRRLAGGLRRRYGCGEATPGARAAAVVRRARARTTTSGCSACVWACRGARLPTSMTASTARRSARRALLQRPSLSRRSRGRAPPPPSTTAPRRIRSRIARGACAVRSGRSAIDSSGRARLPILSGLTLAEIALGRRWIAVAAFLVVYTSATSPCAGGR